MFSHRAEEQFVVLIPLEGSCRHCENSSASLVTLLAVRGEAKPAAGREGDEGGSRKVSNPCWKPFPLLPFSCLGTAHRGKGELCLSPGMQQDPAGMPLEQGVGNAERPREDGGHKSKDLRTQGTSGSLFRLKCVCEALRDSGCKGGGDLAAALLSLLVGIFL